MVSFLPVRKKNKERIFFTNFQNIYLTGEKLHVGCLFGTLVICYFYELSSTENELGACFIC